MCYFALEVAVFGCRRRAHEDVSMPICLDPVRQACQFGSASSSAQRLRLKAVCCAEDSN